MSCWSGRSRIPTKQCRRLPAAVLGFPSEIYRKTLLLKASQALDTRDEEIKLKASSLLASFHGTRRQALGTEEKSSIVLAGCEPCEQQGWHAFQDVAC